MSQANIRCIQANIKQIKVKYLVDFRHLSGKSQSYLRPILGLSLTYLSHISCIFQVYLRHISEHFKVYSGRPKDYL